MTYWNQDGEPKPGHHGEKRPDHWSEHGFGDYEKRKGWLDFLRPWIELAYDIDEGSGNHAISESWTEGSGGGFPEQEHLDPDHSGWLDLGSGHDHWHDIVIDPFSGDGQGN